MNELNRRPLALRADPQTYASNRAVVRKTLGESIAQYGRTRRIL
jgi:hypothetical protein